MDDLVLLEQHNDVVVLKLNRPKARNAMNAALAEAFCDAIVDCQDAGAIVLTGADPAFCAGLDLRNPGIDHLTDMAPFLQTVSDSDVPVIAAVNGPAVTGGFELALVADFIIASERALFADTHLRVGVYPGPVLVELPRRVGMAWARQMSLTGDFVDAAQALRIGIANEVVPHDELLPRAVQLAQAIAEQDRRLVHDARRDWDASAALPIVQARAVHYEHTRAGGWIAAASSDHLQTNRGAVMDRSRSQRETGESSKTDG